jgi:hypothetical protein
MRGGVLLVELANRVDPFEFSQIERVRT